MFSDDYDLTTVVAYLVVVVANIGLIEGSIMDCSIIRDEDFSVQATVKGIIDWDLNFTTLGFALALLLSFLSLLWRSLSCCSGLALCWCHALLLMYKRAVMLVLVENVWCGRLFVDVIGLF